MRLFFAILALIFSQISAAEVSQPLSAHLENGLRYTLVPLHQEKGRIEIRLKVNAGSVDENDDQAGVAHMLEHLVFRATAQYPNGIMPHLHQQKWVRGRNYNAVTTYDSTTYMMTPPANAGLSESLSALSQMLFYAQLTAQDLESERQIIREEWRAGQSVGRRMDRQRTESVRVDSRYARHPVIGTQQSIDSMPVHQLQQFYQQWYVPNNMQLLIVGDIEMEQAKSLIQHYFGSQPAKNLPKRDYYEPTLSAKLRTKQLQDAQSGVSQIAYIFRFNEQSQRQQTEQARYQRLVDRLALMAVTQRLRNQAEQLPKGVNSLVIRKADIGKNTVALGFFAGVEPTSHQIGLSQLLQEMERLKRFPITQAELEREKQKIQAQIDHAKQHNNDRDFSGWVETMLATVLSDKPYLTQPEIAKRSEPLLHKITAAEINLHIQQWLQAADQIVQYQAPRLTQIAPITPKQVLALQQAVTKMAISEPLAEKIIEPMSLAKPHSSGQIVKQQDYPAQQVSYFWLSNGDKVVWLKSPLAKQRSYVEIRSAAGFAAQGLDLWKSQLASQLISQNAPLDWEIEQLNQWKNQHKVNLSLNHKADELIFSGQVENTKLAELWRLYSAYQQEIKVKAGLDEAKEQLQRQLAAQQNPAQQRAQALSQLRYGQSASTLPTAAQLEPLTGADLDQQWQKMVESPVTYYVVNNMTEAEFKPLIGDYLAAIPRASTIAHQPTLPLAGNHRQAFAFHLAPKDQVQIWWFTPEKWQGNKAVMVSLLAQIAQQKLKQRLRDEQLGLYSLRFESKLNPDSHRIETELEFSSDPKLTESLIQQAVTILQNLANSLTEEELKQAKAYFLQSEKERQKQPLIWLQRLILSDKQFNSPQYLSELNQLTEKIDFPNMQSMAKKLYSGNNQVIFITTPLNQKN